MAHVTHPDLLTHDPLTHFSSDACGCNECSTALTLTLTGNVAAKKYNTDNV